MSSAGLVKGAGLGLGLGSGLGFGFATRRNGFFRLVFSVPALHVYL